MATPRLSIRPLWPILASICLALWLGSLAHTLLSVATLFKAYPKAVSDVAVKGAPAIFAATERYHMFLAAASLATVVMWRRTGCSPARRWITRFLYAATALAIVQLAIISPKMEALRAAGESGNPQFGQLHGVSSVQYLMQTACLLIAVGLLPKAFDERACDMRVKAESRETAPTGVPA